MKFRVSVAHMRAYAACLALLSLVLIGLGGFVRATGAGLSCPDWPLCYGRAVPSQLYPGVAQEVAHRYLASLVSLGTIGFAVLSYINRRSYPHLWRSSKLLLLFLSIQVILGGLTVLMRLNPFIVTAHLFAGTCFFQLVLWIALEHMPRTREEQGMRSIARAGNGSRSGLQVAVLVFSIAIFAQLLLGGFVGSSGAALVCPGIPLCFGKLLPDGASGAQVVQMAHRALGGLILLMSFGLAVGVRKLSRGKQKKRGHLLGITGLIIFQMLLGFSNVYFQVPIAVAIAHLVVAQLILAGTLRYYRRIQPGSNLFVNSQSALNEVELGDYTPTKRRFASSIH